MIENIIFDLGGVLIDFDPHTTLRTVFCDADAARIEEVLFGTGLWKSMDTGHRNISNLAQDSCALLPARLHEPLTNLLIHWWSHMPPFPFMETLIRELRDNGYKTYLCSNTPDEVYRHFDDIPALGLLDGIIASCDYGVGKPDRRIFEALYSKYSLDPATCFFIDDMPQNIEGAAQTGMCGYCFAEKDVEKLKTALREKGVRI